MERPLGRLGCRLEGNIKVNHKTQGMIIWAGFAWIARGSSGEVFWTRQ